MFYKALQLFFHHHLTQITFNLVLSYLMGFIDFRNTENARMQTVSTQFLHFMLFK